MSEYQIDAQNSILKKQLKKKKDKLKEIGK